MSGPAEANPVLGTTEGDRRVIAQRWSEESSLVVVLFCAAWCDMCTEFRASFERLSAARPDAMFVWLDIEDDSEICGDVDVENFPTLAIFHGDRLLHFGVSLPQEGNVARLIEQFAERRDPAAAPPAAVMNMASRLRAALSG
jgi:thioredoxin reductase (NADPH)